MLLGRDEFLSNRNPIGVVKLDFPAHRVGVVLNVDAVNGPVLLLCTGLLGGI